MKKILMTALIPLLCACGTVVPDISVLVPESPETPVVVAASPAEDEPALNFIWQEVSGAEGYSWLLADEDGEIVDCGKTGLTSVTVGGLESGFRYDFMVKSFNGNGGESAYSAKVSCETRLPLDENDFYSLWYNGKDIFIGGRRVNRADFPKARIMKMSEISWSFLAKPFDDGQDGGILFIDNSETAYKATAAARTIGRGRIIIGRWRNANQPVFKINGNGAFLWTFDGDVMLRNVTLSAFQTTRPLFAGASGSAQGEAEFLFEDCTLLNSCVSYGIFTEFEAARAVPKAMRFDNCILRANASFFACSGRTATAESSVTSEYFESMQNLQSLTFNDCVFAPATLAEGATDVFAENVVRLAKRGVLVGLYHPNYSFDSLDIIFSGCSSFDLGPGNGTQGLVDVTTLHSATFTDCVFHHSASMRNMYLTNVLLTCPADASYTVTETYSNKVGDYVMSYGPKSKFTGNGGACNAKITVQDGLFGECRAVENYFPKSASLPESIGAEYETKYWIAPTTSEKTEK